MRPAGSRAGNTGRLWSKKGCCQRATLQRETHRYFLGPYTSNLILNTKVLDFIKSGGPTWIVGGTIFEMWLGLGGSLPPPWLTLRQSLIGLVGSGVSISIVSDFAMR